MVNTEYTNAYSEILEILKYIPAQDYDKIPRSKIDFYKKRANKNHNFKYNPEKTLKEQNVSKITKGIIILLFRDYWATEKQKEKIIAKQNYDRDILEEENKEKYNPDNIFKNTSNNVSENNNVNTYSEKSLITMEKKTILQKIYERIRKFFR